MESLFVRLSELAKLVIDPQNHVFFCMLLVMDWPFNWPARPWKAPLWVRRACLIWILLLFSPVPSWGLYHYERQVPNPPVKRLQGLTALVLMGSTGIFHRPMGQMDWLDNSGRAQEPLRLFRKGILKKLVVTGSRIYAIHPDEDLDEAPSIAQWWQEMGVPVSAIIVESKAKNTHENFAFSMPFLPKNEDIVLVTSAFHMPRALAVAKKMGLNHVIPYPVDYKLDGRFEWFSWENLQNAQRLLFELLGRAAYHIVGFGS